MCPCSLDPHEHIDSTNHIPFISTGTILMRLVAAVPATMAVTTLDTGTTVIVVGKH